MSIKEGQSNGVSNELGAMENNGDPLREPLGHSVEIRRVDIESDRVAMAAIATIFNEPEAIEHLSGIAPATTGRNIESFRQNIRRYLPAEQLQGLTEEALQRIAGNLVRATRVGITDYFRRLGNAEVYVAEVQGRIVGTGTLEMSRGAGKTTATITKVAVSKDAPRVVEESTGHPGKGIGRQLVQFLGDRASDLGYLSLDASVIRDVEGKHAPLDMFMNQGYGIQGQTLKGDLAWNNRIERYELKDIINLKKIITRTPTSS